MASLIHSEIIKKAAENSHKTIRDILHLLEDESLILHGQDFVDFMNHFEIFRLGNGICFANEIDDCIRQSNLRIAFNAQNDKCRVPTLPFYVLIVNTANSTDAEGKHWILFIYDTLNNQFGLFDTYDRDLNEIFDKLPTCLDAMPLVKLGGGYQSFFSIACGYYIINFLYYLSLYKEIPKVVEEIHKTLLDRSKILTCNSKKQNYQMWEVIRIGLQNDINIMRDVEINLRDTSIKHAKWYNNLSIKLLMFN